MRNRITERQGTRRRREKARRRIMKREKAEAFVRRSQIQRKQMVKWRRTHAKKKIK